MIKEPTGWVANCENCWKELSSDDIDECFPRDEDEFIEYLNNQGWVVDEDGEVYCCEECIKKRRRTKMSDKNQETISYIVKEMHGNAEHNHALVEVAKYLN